jgi:hypothetical protein
MHLATVRSEKPPIDFVGLMLAKSRGKRHVSCAIKKCQTSKSPKDVTASFQEAILSSGLAFGFHEWGRLHKTLK